MATQIQKNKYTKNTTNTQQYHTNIQKQIFSLPKKVVGAVGLEDLLKVISDVEFTRLKNGNFSAKNIKFKRGFGSFNTYKNLVFLEYQFQLSLSNLHRGVKLE